MKPSNSPASASLQVSTSSELSLDVSTATTLVNVPVTVLEGIWIKAKRLTETAGALAPAPGELPEAKMVLSYSGKPPHLVIPKKNGDSAAIKNGDSAAILVVLTGSQ